MIDTITRMVKNPPHPKIHAYLAQAGVASRRKSEAMVEQGKVLVNGKPATIGQRVNPSKDVIKIGKNEIKPLEEYSYYLLYKPVGVVSTVNDELDRPSILSLIPKTEQRLYPVGRLDMESEGLILLTNNGQLTQKLTHPSYQIEKTYEVLISGIPSTPALNHLKRGVKLKEGFIEPKLVKILGREDQRNTWLSITIDEGHKHQVRRMIRRIGYDILRLKRVRMGKLTLGELRPKEYRQLSTEESNDLFGNMLD